MAEHYLDSSTTQPFWDNAVTPRLEIESGDVVVFECPEVGNQFTPEWTTEDMLNADGSKFHALIGSVWVKGARRGDTLQVEVLEMAHHGWGWTAYSPGFGLLTTDFDAIPYLHHWRLQGADCHFGIRDIVVPFEPFCGVMGVAPAAAGRFPTAPPHQGGGNMDVRNMGTGSTVWLPVQVEGALFACGDCHAAQGHGEVCGTAIESPMTVTLRLSVRRDFSVREAQLQCPSPLTRADSTGYHATTAHGPDLMENARNAVRYMIDWLEGTKGLTRPQAYVLCSCAADLALAQVVNAGQWVVGCYLPLSIFQA